jgi:hypothetical protein
MSSVITTMKIGTYVKQLIFDSVYRYGIVISTGDHPWFEKKWPNKTWTQVAWTPRQDHPVANLPYQEYVKTSELEVISS